MTWFLVGFYTGVFSVIVGYCLFSMLPSDKKETLPEEGPTLRKQSRWRV